VQDDLDDIHTPCEHQSRSCHFFRLNMPASTRGQLDTYVFKFLRPGSKTRRNSFGGAGSGGQSGPIIVKTCGHRIPMKSPLALFKSKERSR